MRRVTTAGDGIEGAKMAAVGANFRLTNVNWFTTVVRRTTASQTSPLDHSALVTGKEITGALSSIHVVEKLQYASNLHCVY